MGDRGTRTANGPRWQSYVTCFVVLTLVGLLGCASTPTEMAGFQEADPAQVRTTQVEPVQITSLELRELAPGAELELLADGPVVWTQYRDVNDNLILELPNTVLSPGVGELAPEVGLIALVTVETEREGERPLTRFTIQTRQAAEHSLTTEENSLHLRLKPVGMQPAPALAFEPIGEEPVPTAVREPAAEVAVLEEMPQPEPPPLPVLGTPDRPQVGPRPAGISATRLEGVEVVAANEVTLIRIVGDGEFTYASFRLEEPERFVIDLNGVVNMSSQATVPVDSELVDQVRMAQFSGEPDLVSRVVFDLSQASAPLIERTGDGLTIRFEAPGSALPLAPPTQVAVVEPMEPEPMESEPDSPQEEIAELVPEPAPGAPEPEVAELVLEPGLDEPETELAPVESEPLEIVELVPEPEPFGEPQRPATETSLVQPLSEPVPGETEPAPIPVDPLLSPPFVAEPGVAATEPLGEVDVAQRGEPAEEPVGLQETQPTQPQPPAQAPTTDIALFEAQDVAVEEPAETQEPTVPSFGAQSLTGEKQYFGDPISMSLKDADITEVLRSIARISDLNIVIQPGVRGPVTVELARVPWDQALDQILKINGLGMQLEGNILRIAPISRLRNEAEEQLRLERAKALSIPLSTILKRISYAEARDIARILTTGSGTAGGVMSQRGSITVDDRTNTLIIKELPRLLNTVVRIIEILDVPEPQVMIEARVVETTKNFSRSLGIQWDFDGVSSPRFGNSTGLEFPNNADVEGGVSLFTGGANGFLNVGLGNVLNTFELDIALIAAENEGLVNVISAPKVATLNNRRASIQTGLQIPVQTVANNTVTVQFVNATLRLDVTPHVTAEGTVLMDINIQKREPQLAFAVVGATNAPIATRSARTRVIVRDGGTTVIGGIYEITTSEGQDRVPGLANIPILGHLFKNRNKDNTNEELLIFITPRVIQL